MKNKFEDTLPKKGISQIKDDLLFQIRLTLIRLDNEGETEIINAYIDEMYPRQVRDYILELSSYTNGVTPCIANAII